MIVWNVIRGCTSLLKTEKGFELFGLSEHNHPKDDQKFNKVLMNAKINEIALATHESGRDIVVEFSSKSSKNVMIKYRTVEQLVNRTRRKNNLTNETFYDIPKELHTTSRGKSF
ncbi:hypothetical protein DMUE_0040 [Dictyocoela muelleri]|nr:hypothetical protein DMUE_0040 [Dictyocoela muelleri]